MFRRCRWSALVLVALLAAACSAGPGPALEGDAAPAASAGDDGLPDPTPMPTSESDVETIRVGVILDGSNLMTALDRQPGVAFAGSIEAINAAGGVLGQPVELLVVDSESRLSVIHAAAREMVEAGVAMIVITCELDFATPAIEQAEPAGVLIMSPCASEPSWSAGTVSDLAFSLVGPADVYGADMADLLWSEGDRSAAVLWDETAPEARAECDGFVSRWAELGGAITTASPMNVETVASLVDNADLIANLDSDVIALCAFKTIGTRVLEAIRSSEIVTPIVAGPSLDSADFRPRDVEGLGDFRLVSFASPDGDDPEDDVADAVERFRQVDGIPPASGRFVLGADLAAVWVAGVEAAGTVDGAAVADAIQAFSSIDAVSGPVGFGRSHAATDRALRVRRFVDGGFQFERTFDG